MAVEFPASEHENAARAVIEQAGAALAARRSDIPADLRRAALRPRGGGGRAVLRGRRSRRSGRARLRFSQGAAAGRAENPLRNGGAERVGRAQVGLGDRDRQRRHAVPGRLGDGRARRAPAQRAAGGASGVRRAARRRQARRARRPDAAGGARESFIHIHLEPIADEAARADLVRALAGVLGEVRLAVQDWRAMLERVNGIVADLKTNPPPLPVDEIAEAIQFLQWLLADNFTFLGMRNYIFDGNALEPDFDSALGIMRSRELRVLKQRQRAARIHAGNHGVPQGAAPADHRQGQHPRARAPARLSRLYRHQALRRFRQSGRRAAHRRAVHLHRLYALGAQHSLSAPQDRRRRGARRLRSRTAIPARRWPTCWSIIRATNCSRSTTTRSIISRSPSCSSTSGRACACWRGATASTASCRCWCSCRANATTAISARASATISAAPSSGASRRSIRSSRKVRWCACTSSSAAPAATRPRSTARHWSARSRPSCARGPTGSATRWRWLNPPDKARELFDRYRDAFSQGFQEVYAPAVAATDIRTVEALSETAPARRRVASPAWRRSSTAPA